MKRALYFFVLVNTLRTIFASCRVSDISVQPNFDISKVGSNLIKHISESVFSMIIYRLLAERRISFLPIVSLKFVVKCAANVLKIGLRKKKKKKKKIGNLHGQRRRWILGHFFGLDSAVLVLGIFYEIFRIFRENSDLNSPACHFPIQNSLFTSILDIIILFVNRFSNHWKQAAYFLVQRCFATFSTGTSLRQGKDRLCLQQMQDVGGLSLVVLCHSCLFHLFDSSPTL